MMWNYYRNNYEILLQEFGLDSPALGIILLEITRSFEDEFLFFEVNDDFT